MMTKTTSGESGTTPSPNHRLASVVFILCLHLTALAIALLVQEPEPAGVGNKPV